MKIKFSKTALFVLRNRYLLKNEKGKIIETPGQMLERVAKVVAQADKKYSQNPKEAEKQFFETMASLDFLPNSPTLMNAGTKIGQLSACFVLPVEDSIDSIFDSLKNMAKIHQSGGGTGFNFSHLRPRSDLVKTTKGVASGPVSFMQVYDKATDVIKAGGRRRGANMGILNYNHPDILEFINAKKYGLLQNFNLSVAVDKKFIDAVAKNQNINLINPRTGKSTKKIRARAIFDQIITNAYNHGDPGLIFIDEINKYNPLKKLGAIESTNPCGEQPLLPYESCNLGSINLSHMTKNGQIDWPRLQKTTHTAVHFLDNVIDVNNFPSPEIEKQTKANRKIGLGIMGFAEMLIKLNCVYGSPKSFEIAQKVMHSITKEAREASAALGQKRGSFPNFKKSIWAKKFKILRNATVTTIAPTGTISLIADTTSGIEPIFSPVYSRKVIGEEILIVNNLLIDQLKRHLVYTKDIEQKLFETPLSKIKEIPSDIKKLFITCLEIKPEAHVKMQAIFQKYTDNAVSKTVNLPPNATKQDVRKIYLLAHKLHCKGITVYRYGSKPGQVVTVCKACQ